MKEIDTYSAWMAGFRSDHRFGPYRIYPVLGYCRQVDSRWNPQLALPDLRITRLFSDAVSISLFADPDGNRWYVFSW